MKFSICIPNFNYEKYLGQTLRSALAQEGELEIVIADNASTDRSVEIAKGFADPRIKIAVNATNVGFAGNLDRAGRMASGEWMLMLSSDDLMQPGALAAYRKLTTQLETDAVITSRAEIIDSDGAKIGTLGPDPQLFHPDEAMPGLSGPGGAKVYRVEAAELLKRCLLTQRNPFNFLATAYPRALYQQVEGYGAGRMINPDKWFHWRLLSVAKAAYFVDAPLFSYRWHAKNQTAQQAQSGALKYLVDEYVSTVEVDRTMLERAGLTRAQLERAFVEHDVARHGLATLASGDAVKARRILLFGASTYPAHLTRTPLGWALGALALSGAPGVWAAKLAYRFVNGGRNPSAQVG